jgi:ketosteroid isomerase-like protein
LNDKAGNKMDDMERLEELERGRIDALLKGDVQHLQSIYSDDAMWIHSSGHADGRATLLDWLSKGVLKFHAMDCVDRSIRIYGDSAVSSSLDTLVREVNKNVQTVQNRTSVVWSRSQGDWRVVHWQSTAVPTR